MRIPPSVIVMSLVTAVPFALAVRDTMKPHEKTVDEMTDEEREAHYEQEMRKEAEQEAQRQAAQTAKREQTYRTLFGQKPAQLGPFFNGVFIGMSGEDPAIDALPHGDYETTPTIDYDRSRTLEAIRIAGDDHCDELHNAMVKAWGDSPDGVYLDAASHVRAKFTDCLVTFDRYVEVNEWVDKKDTAPVSLSLVGKSVEKLSQLVPDLDEDSGPIRNWTAPGIGRGTGPARMSATIDNGKVVHVTVSVVTDAPTSDAVRARLVGLLGKGTSDPDDPDQIEWKGKGSLTVLDDTLTLDLGR